jgi:predicted Zn finger-like uncharacterized protein
MNSTLPLVVNSRLVPDGLATAALRNDEQDIARHAVCPMCHTSASVTQAAVDAGGDWRCVRCGQHWDARRLATVAAYAEWAHRDRVRKRVAEGDRIATPFGDAAVEPVDGGP